MLFRKGNGGYEVIERLKVGGIKSIEKTVELRNDNHASLVIQASHTSYRFLLYVDGKEIHLGTAQTKFQQADDFPVLKPDRISREK